MSATAGAASAAAAAALGKLRRYQYERRMSTIYLVHSSGWGILIYCVSFVVISSFSFSFFHSSFIQCYPLGSSYLVGKVLSIGI